ncbi:MAG: hypothetical protein WCV84_06155 [Patescibacteria group bacterium]|jgi:hypothetical protein
MKTRKTIEISALLEKGNSLLSAPDHKRPDGTPYITREMRLGTANMLECALYLANRYRGYGMATIPGVQYFDTTPTTDNPHGHWIITDDSRRVYY